MVGEEGILTKLSVYYVAKGSRGQEGEVRGECYYPFQVLGEGVCKDGEDGRVCVGVAGGRPPAELRIDGRLPSRAFSSFDARILIVSLRRLHVPPLSSAVGMGPGGQAFLQLPGTAGGLHAEGV